MTHDRPLDVNELRALATDLAASTSLWQDCIRHDPAQRTFHPLAGTDHTIDTGFHDHDGCSGAAAVVEGAVREERIRWAHVPAARTVEVLQRHVVPEGEELRADAFAAVA